MNILRVCLDRI